LHRNFLQQLAAPDLNKIYALADADLQKGGIGFQ
jgi:hypothetical protein